MNYGEFIHCEGGKNLPEQNKGKVCLFRRGGKIVDMEVCVLVSSIYNPDNVYWIVKGDSKGTPVYPFAYLNLTKELPEEFVSHMLLAGSLTLTGQP